MRREMAMRSGGPRGGGYADASSLLQVHKTFSALSIPAYRLLWLSMLTSFAGMQMQMVARGVLAYQIGGTNSAIAVVSLAWGLPMLLFSLVGGTLADRLDRRKLMMLSLAASGVMSLVVAGLVQAGYIQLWHLFASGLIQGTVFSFSGPARQALIPQVVGEKELLNAVALNSAGMNLTRIGVPSLAGALIAVPAVDVQGVYYIQAVMSILAIVLVMALPRLRVAPEVEAELEAARAEGRPVSAFSGSHSNNTSMMKDLVDGLRYVIGSPILLTLMALGLFPSLIGMSYQSFLPVFAKDVFGDGIHRNSSGLGFMLTMSGVGALAGSLVVASMQGARRRALLQLMAGLGSGIFLALFAVQNDYTMAIIWLVAVGFMGSYFQALNSTMVMTASDPQYYGRVMSVNMMTFALMPLGTLPIGAIADWIGKANILGVNLVGIQAAQLGAGVLVAIFILFVTVLNPAYRRLEQEDLKSFARIAIDRVQEDQGGLSGWQQIKRAMRYERGSKMAGHSDEDGIAPAAERLPRTLKQET